MIKIAHRGLLYGPDPLLENQPEQIEKCLYLGYEVEVDVWYQNGWWLGHDAPTTPISLSFLERQGIWAHCKNVEALSNASDDLHFFWHQTDDYTLTSNGIIWVYPGATMAAARRSVWVMPELSTQVHQVEDQASQLSPYGICTDYLNAIYPAINRDLP